MDIHEIKIGEELLLADLKPGMAIALEATAPAISPPDPLYLPGAIKEIVAACVIVRLEMHQSVYGGTMRLHANHDGRFHANDDSPIRVFRLLLPDAEL